MDGDFLATSHCYSQVWSESRARGTISTCVSPVFRAMRILQLHHVSVTCTCGTCLCEDPLCTEGARAGEDPPQRPTPTSARPSRPLALRPVCRSAVSSAEFVARRLSPARPIAFTIARLEDSTTRTQSNMPSHASPHWPTCSRVAILGRGGLRCGACGRCLPQLLHLVQVVVHAVLKLTHHLDRGGRPAATIE